MKQHNIAHYLDDRRWIPYCKICSAEGEKLLEGCPQHPTVNIPASHVQNNLDNARDALDSNYDND